MSRAFEARPVDTDVVDRVLDAARRAPSAGNSQGWAFVVLEGADTAKFWDATLPVERRAGFRWQRLLDAPVIVLPLADRGAYTSRYAEPDKASTGLADAGRWPVPYWQVDTAFATMLLLLAAEDVGLGALFFGVFRGADRLLDTLGVPDDFELIGAVALGHPLPEESGLSASRPRRELAEVVHRGGWSEAPPLGFEPLEHTDAPLPVAFADLEAPVEPLPVAFADLEAPVEPQAEDVVEAHDGSDLPRPETI